MKNWFTLLFCTLSLAATGQRISFGYAQDAVISVGGRPLPNAWAGGLNACQYGTLLLNNDTRPDLVVFDRTTDKISTFLATTDANGTFTWQHAPAYERQFPAFRNWMILADYDNDGRKDLFASAPSGMQVWRNVPGAGGALAWQLVASPVNQEGLSGRSNLYVAGSDTPAITDYDQDGDLDVVAFDVGGDLAVYYQNMSRERTSTVAPAGLDFKRMGQCWGNFQKNLCNDFQFGINCDAGGRRGVAGARPMHSGNTITLFDTNGDGRLELLFGYVSCPNVAVLYNRGPNSAKADFVSFDADFPARNPVRFPAFPGVYFEDVDADGRADLLASPNVSGNDGNAFNFQASSLFYKNTGTLARPDFQFVQPDFLQSDMVDLGENAAPALLDLDADGDLDLLVGHAGAQGTSGYRAGLWQFENRGTAARPAFNLLTTNYLGLLQSDSLTNLRPVVADLDQNGSPDLVLTASTGAGAQILWWPNQASKGSPAQFSRATAQRLTLPGNLGYASSEPVMFADVDADAKLDMLIGGSAGNVTYLRNTGTATSPAFTFQTDAYAGFGIDLNARNATLVWLDVNADGQTELLRATRNGSLRLFRPAPDPTRPGTLLDTLAALGNPGLGLTVATGDLDADGLPDLLLGTAAGGLRYVRNSSEKVKILALPEPAAPWVFPNPAAQVVTVRAPYSGQLDVLDLAGRVVLVPRAVVGQTPTRLDLGTLPGGVYVLRLRAGGNPPLTTRLLLTR